MDRAELKRMKRTVQTTLTGGFLKKKPLHRIELGGNHSLYCKFVDAYCSFDDRPRAVAISEAQEEWRKIRGDTAAVEKRIEKLQLRGSGSKESCLAGGWSVLTSDPVSAKPSSETRPVDSYDHGAEASSTPATGSSGTDNDGAKAGSPLWSTEAKRIVNEFLVAVDVNPTLLLTPDVQMQSLFLAMVLAIMTFL